MPRLPPPTSLPPEVAQELASYMSSTLFAPLVSPLRRHSPAPNAANTPPQSSNTSRLREEYEDTMVAQKDMVQDVPIYPSSLIIFLGGC